MWVVVVAVGVGMAALLYGAYLGDDYEWKGSDVKMPTSNTMKLSEAITKGIAMRPKRATGVYFAGTDKSDVLGAAYQGLTGESDVHNYQVDGKLEQAFPLLKQKVMNPETGELKTLKTVVRQLNDVHRWKRRNVARFVQSVEDRRRITEPVAS